MKAKIRKDDDETKEENKRDNIYFCLVFSCLFTLNILNPNYSKRNDKERMKAFHNTSNPSPRHGQKRIWTFITSFSPSHVHQKKKNKINKKEPKNKRALVSWKAANCCPVGDTRIAVVVVVVFAVVWMSTAHDGGDGGGEHSREVRVGGDGCGDCVSKRWLLLVLLQRWPWSL